MNRVRIAIGMLMILLVSCREAGKYEKPETIEPKWAGQYILNDSGEPSRLQSLRYILSPDGSAERHLLRKSNRWADFRLEVILRGQWSSGEQSINIRKAGGAGWDAFAGPASADVDKIVEDLEKTASAKEPEKQRMLWAARDHLKKILGTPGDVNSPDDQKFRQYMEYARSKIGGSVPEVPNGGGAGS